MSDKKQGTKKGRKGTGKKDQKPAEKVTVSAETVRRLVTRLEKMDK